MPRYNYLKKLPKDVRDHTIAGLLRIRKSMKEVHKVPPRTMRDTLLLATWNIRDFGKEKSGPRMPEALYYMAEYISHFDIVAIQEVNENLNGFRELLRLLGDQWHYIATDVTDYVATPGNGERMVFLYDTRKVSFTSIAGEIVLPKDDLVLNQLQFARTPFMVSFQAGWLVFNLCTVHIYYGKDSGEKLAQRIDEIDAIAEFIAERAKREKMNYILLGDFNIKNPGDETMKPLQEHGFFVPEALQLPTNLSRKKYYDQIAFMTRSRMWDVNVGDQLNQVRAGVVTMYDDVFRKEDWSYFEDRVNSDNAYAGERKSWEENSNGEPRTDEGKEDYFSRYWRTYQMSDHYPLWVELRVDFTEHYLKYIKK